MFTVSCIAILLPWSQDKGMQVNHSKNFLPSNSFSQSHVPVKSVSCIQGELKDRLVCLLGGFWVGFFFPERVPQILKNLLDPPFSPQIQPYLIKIVLAQLGTT